MSHDHPGEEGQERREVVGAEERELPRVEAAGDSGEGRADRERLELVGEHVLAERGRRVLVLADRAQHPTPRRPHREPDEREQHDRDGPDDHEHRNVLRGDAEPSLNPRLEALPLPVVLRRRADLAERDRPLRAAGEPVLVRRHVADDLAEGDRDDREEVGAEPQRRDPEQEACRACHGHSERGGEPRAPALLHDEDRHRVGADRHEGDLAEVQQAREAELELQPEREDRVDPGDHADERPEAAARERVHTTLARPKRPCGRTISAPMRTAKATTGL